MAQHTVLVQLTKQIPKIGNAGDVTAVPFGYAKNYLFPNKLAVPSTAREASNHRTRLAQTAAKQRQASTELETIAQKLAGKTATLHVQANAQGHLFASVQAADVAAALGIAQAFRMEPLKQAGNHAVTLDFGHGVTTTITVSLTSDAAKRS